MSVYWCLWYCHYDRSDQVSSSGSFDECRQRQASADPQTRPTGFGNDITCRVLLSTPTIAMYYYYYYSAPKPTFILPSNRGWIEGWVYLDTAVRASSLCQRLYTAVAVVINTTVGGEIRTNDLAHCSSIHSGLADWFQNSSPSGPVVNL